MAESIAIAEYLPASPRQCLGVRGISKYFGEFAANRDVTLSVDKGEIHALLGENGAGKSTLVKMIYGILKPDSGSMELLANPYSPDSPGDAKYSGVGMVFQH
ncbi:MAG: ATP-binding cassette domain-containing protein, partial [Litorivicinaceae bacterium]